MANYVWYPGDSNDMLYFRIYIYYIILFHPIFYQQSIYSCTKCTVRFGNHEAAVKHMRENKCKPPQNVTKSLPANRQTKQTTGSDRKGILSIF